MVYLVVWRLVWLCDGWPGFVTVGPFVWWLAWLCDGRSVRSEGWSGCVSDGWSGCVTAGLVVWRLVWLCGGRSGWRTMGLVVLQWIWLCDGWSGCVTVGLFVWQWVWLCDGGSGYVQRRPDLDVGGVTVWRGGGSAGWPGLCWLWGQQCSSRCQWWRPSADLADTPAQTKPQYTVHCTVPRCADKWRGADLSLAAAAQ